MAAIEFRIVVSSRKKENLQSPLPLHKPKIPDVYLLTSKNTHTQQETKS